MRGAITVPVGLCKSACGLAGSSGRRRQCWLAEHRDFNRWRSSRLGARRRGRPVHWEKPGWRSRVLKPPGPNHTNAYRSC